MTYKHSPSTEEILDGYLKGIGGPCQRDFSAEVEEFDRWLAEEIRQAKEVTWEEGYSVGYKDYPNAGTTVPVPDNPYWRK